MASLTANILLSLFSQCASDVAPETLYTLIGVESSQNPYAIAVVYDKGVKEEDKLKFRQPQTEEEAQATISAIEAHPVKAKSYSIGLMQVNSANFASLGLNKSNMFKACRNIEAGAAIFKACYAEAKNNNPNKHEQELLRLASSCYYSGNEIRGFKKESNGTSYVDRINKVAEQTYKVPAIKPLNGSANYMANSSNNVDSYSTENAPQVYPEPPKKVKPWDIFGDF